ncbi:MAG: flagellar basal body-associated FliL family protein [Thermodesulfobacteriota bacterium]
MAGDPVKKEPKPRGKRRSVWIAGAAFLALFGIGGAGYFGVIPIPGFTRQQTPSSDAQKMAEPGPVVKLSPLIVNLKEEGGRNYLKTIIVMEVGKKAWVEEVQSKMPRLMDMAILTLSDKRLADLRDPESKEKLKQELLVKINEHLDSKKIKQVYFDEFLYQ